MTPAECRACGWSGDTYESFQICPACGSAKLTLFHPREPKPRLPQPAGYFRGARVRSCPRQNEDTAAS